MKKAQTQPQILLIDQYHEECLLCRHKAENAVQVECGYLYCGMRNLMLKVDKLKESAIFCDEGKKQLKLTTELPDE